MQKLGVIHYNFPGFSLTDFLRYASETGYGYVELARGDVLGEGIESHLGNLAGKPLRARLLT